MLLPPTSRTTRSGRSTPSAVVTEACSVKSQRSVIPASSTHRRSCSSPHRPRACGLRSALTSDAVSWRRSSPVRRTNSICWVSDCWAPARSFSISRSWSSTLPSVSVSGLPACAKRLSARLEELGVVACQRLLRQPGERVLERDLRLLEQRELLRRGRRARCPAGRDASAAALCAAPAAAAIRSRSARSVALSARAASRSASVGRAVGDATGAGERPAGGQAGGERDERDQGGGDVHAVHRDLPVGQFPRVTRPRAAMIMTLASRNADAPGAARRERHDHRRVGRGTDA